MQRSRQRDPRCPYLPGSLSRTVRASHVDPGSPRPPFSFRVAEPHAAVRGASCRKQECGVLSRGFWGWGQEGAERHGPCPHRGARVEGGSSNSPPSLPGTLPALEALSHPPLETVQGGSGHRLALRKGKEPGRVDVGCPSLPSWDLSSSLPALSSWAVLPSCFPSQVGIRRRPSWLGA